MKINTYFLRERELDEELEATVLPPDERNYKNLPYYHSSYDAVIPLILKLYGRATDPEAWHKRFRELSDAVYKFDMDNNLPCFYAPTIYARALILMVVTDK